MGSSFSHREVFKIKLRNREAPNTHDLDKLCQVANNISGVSIKTYKIKQKPSHHETILHRYGEAGQVGIQQAITNYQNTRDIFLLQTETLERKLRMNNARLLINLPPWQMP